MGLARLRASEFHLNLKCHVRAFPFDTGCTVTASTRGDFEAENHGKNGPDHSVRLDDTEDYGQNGPDH